MRIGKAVDRCPTPPHGPLAHLFPLNSSVPEFSTSMGKSETFDLWGRDEASASPFHASNALDKRERVIND